VASKTLHPRQDPSRRCLSPEQWPELDRQAHAAALAPGDLLEPGGLAAAWSPHTRHKNAQGYGRWLTWLGGQGLLDPHTAPESRVTRERVVAYVHDLQAINASYTVLARVEELAHMLRVMVPGYDVAWLYRLAGRIRATVVSSRDKRHRVKPSEQLADLGLDLMARAEGDTAGTPRDRAIAYRDGLMIVLLAARPIRRRNFAALEIGRHLVPVGGGWWLRIPAVETKTGEPIDVPLPDGLQPHLQRYLDHHRPLLAQYNGRWRGQGAGNALWVSAHGSAMTEIAIHFRFRNLTHAKFGHVVNQHLFRDSAATSIAIEDPEHVRGTMAVLGHGRLATSETYYNHSGSLQAFRRLQRHVLKRRGEAKQASRRAGSASSGDAS